MSGLFENGAAHSSINCYRSAVSLLVGPDMVKDFRMLSFFKGISKLRPSNPKYNSTWDPKVVLEYFTGLSHNDKLSIKDLVFKLITLMAFVTGHRMQTFSLIRVENIEIRDKFIEIKISDRIKTSAINKKQPSLHLPFYNKNKKISPAAALKCYLEKTKDVRGSVNFLFISFKPP